MVKFLITLFFAPLMVFTLSRQAPDPISTRPSVPIYFFWGNANGSYSSCVAQDPGGCGAVQATSSQAPPPKDATKALLMLSDEDHLIIEFSKTQLAPELMQVQFKDGRFYQPSTIQWDKGLLKLLGTSDTLKTLDAGFHPIESDAETVRILL